MAAWGTPFSAGRVGWIFRGEWDSASGYVFLDVVSSGGILYIVTNYTSAPPVGTLPTDGVYWEVLMRGESTPYATTEDYGSVKLSDGVIASDGTDVITEQTYASALQSISELQATVSGLQATPTVYTLTPTITHTDNVSHYWKDAQGQVTVNIRMGSGTVTTTSQTIMTMPVGFRPTHYVYGVHVSVLSGTVYTRDASISETGVLTLHYTATGTFQWITSSLRYTAAAG